MVISNIHNDYDIELKYDENILKIVYNHKQISLNNKRSKGIDSITNSASKQISYLQKLKFHPPKCTLNKLYWIYARIYAPFIKICFWNMGMVVICQILTS